MTDEPTQRWTLLHLLHTVMGDLSFAQRLELRPAPVGALEHVKKRLGTALSWRLASRRL